MTLTNGEESPIFGRQGQGQEPEVHEIERGSRIKALEGNGDQVQGGFSMLKVYYHMPHPMPVGIVFMPPFVKMSHTIKKHELQDNEELIGCYGSYWPEGTR